MTKQSIVYEMNIGIPQKRKHGYWAYPSGGMGRGIFAGGTTGSDSNVIDYITIATIGNAADFGDLTVARTFCCGCASSVRGIFSGSITSNTIDYITISTKGNAQDFGDLSVHRWSSGSHSNETRGLILSGIGPAPGYTVYNTIDYITISTIGNATDFGDCTNAVQYPSACGSSTRACKGGGYNTVNVIDYVTIATTGNALDFGDLSVGRLVSQSCSSSTRGLWLGGNNGSYLNTIDYITIATTGNAQDFGDLQFVGTDGSATSNCIRAVSSFGQGSFGSHTRIQYVTIATTGNSSDFGNLTANRWGTGACSDCHGGLA